MNLFGNIRARRAAKKQLRRLGSLSSAFATIARLEKSGLINWERRNRRLFIAEPLGTLMLARGAEAWGAFLNNIYLYLVYRHAQEHWDSICVRRQGAAVAAAKEKNGGVPLSREEIRLIRQRVARELAESEVQPGPIKEFEFYVLSSRAASDPEASLCGVYDPDTRALELVGWDELRSAVSRGS